MVFLPQLLNLFHNQIVGGGLLLMGTGSILALLRNIPSNIWGRFKSQCIVSVTITAGDPLFDWITIWLADHPYSKKTRRILAHTKDKGGENKQPEVIYSPAKGEHFFFYQGKFIWLSRDKEGDSTGSGSSKEGSASETSQFRKMMQPEQYTFRTIGRSQEAVRCLLSDVIKHTEKERQEKTEVFASNGSWWEKMFSYKARSLDSVFLEGEKKEDLLKDMQIFLTKEQKDWYTQRGVPYGRKYMFYGPPGNGKTSIIGALAGKLGLNLYVLNLSDPSISDAGLASLVRNVRTNSLLLLEDVDAAVPSRTNVQTEGVKRTKKNKAAQSNTEGCEASTADDGKGITLSGLLNILDGVLTPDGIMVVMTTNKINVLDPALVRPGRVDKKVEFGFATKDQIIKSFNWFYESKSSSAVDFAEQFVGDVSMATVQQKLLDLKEN